MTSNRWVKFIDKKQMAFEKIRSTSLPDTSFVRLKFQLPTLLREHSVKHMCQKANSLRVFKYLHWQNLVISIYMSGGNLSSVSRRYGLRLWHYWQKACKLCRWRLPPIKPLPRYNMPDTALRLLHVSTSPRNKMHMAMHHRLARCFSAINPYIKSQY